MAKHWDKIQITTENKTTVEAQAPVIVSASRATDIPAFYANWLIHRLKKGYLRWRNPFNSQSLYVSFAKMRLIVFWSKNPQPMLQHIDWLNENALNYYFQYTLNDYNRTIEQNVPDLDQRIATFVKLSETIGREKVIWRFDPLILTHKTGTDELLRRIENIGNQLKGHTQKLVISFADLKNYRKVQHNLQQAQITYTDFDEHTMREIASGLQTLNQQWDFEISTCAENIDLQPYGITHNKCIDEQLIKKLFAHDTALMNFLGYDLHAPNLLNTNYQLVQTRTTNLKDNGQRKACNCIVSKDIGQYNTCPHACTYCYANTSTQTAYANYNSHKTNPKAETITTPK